MGQQYRDLVKLIPGVQYTEDTVRGPSAGGSGQDNVYLFDGVNVSLPLYGTLASEPASHDVDQFAVIKGGAAATDFNRAAGFMVNSVSKSGTNAFHGMISYQIQPESLIANRTSAAPQVYEEDKDWTVANLGGPIFKDRLFFYASYYRPTSSRQGTANVYGPVPDRAETRDEYFGKLTWSPTQSLLINASYRTSDHTQEHWSVGSRSAASTSTGYEATLDIATLEASWTISQNSFLTFKATDFANDNLGRPDTVLDFDAAIDGSMPLDIDNLESQGYFYVPVLITGQDAFNAFAQPLIDR